MKILNIPLTDIKVSNRIRLDEAVTGSDFNILKRDISIHGLLNPITLSPDLQLLAGCRRLRAVKLLNWETIPAHIVDVNEPIEKLLIEIIENKDRKNFSWQEEVEAKGKLFEMLREKEDISIDRFSQDYLGQSKGHTSLELKVYQAAQESPEAKERLYKYESKRLAMERVITDRAAACEAEQIKRDEKSLPVKQSASKVKIPKLYLDAEDMLLRLRQHSVDVCVTDPPYGKGIERKSGKDIFHDTNYDDSWEVCEPLLLMVIKGLRHAMKPGAHVYFFFDIKFRDSLEILFTNNGFSVCSTPLIWVKEGLKIASDAHYYPMRQYECVLMAFAPGERRKLAVTGLSDILVHRVVHGKDRTHPLEKPVNLYADLICRSGKRGDVMIDPFCGTGNSLIAGAKLGLMCHGAEIEEEYRNAAAVKIRDEFGRMGRIVK